MTQTAGRAARNVNGLVIMYADTITDSMQRTIYETDRRRTKQMEYNKLHGITPQQVGVKKNVLLLNNKTSLLEIIQNGEIYHKNQV